MPNARKDQNRIPTIIGTSSVDGITPVLIYADPTTHRLYVDLVGGGGGLTPIVITGTVNGANVTFTCTQPTYVVSDGVWNRATDSQASPATNWTWAGGTLTMTVPPQSDIYGF